MSAPYPHMLPFFFHSATSAGAGGGDEDPHRNPYRLKSAHEADEPGDQNPYQEAETNQSTQPKRIRRNYPADPGPFGPCPVCQRSFKSSKALHGHMRCHPERAWRGMVPPGHWDPHAGAVFGAKMGGASASASSAGGSGGGSVEWLFRCRDCDANFRTKQALGGHRASHKSKKGCYMRAREGLGLFQGENVIPAPVSKENVIPGQVIRAENYAGAKINNNNNNNINNNNNNNNHGGVAGIGNNGGGSNNRRDGLGQGSGIVDLNLPPPQEEEEEEEEDVGK